jgi:hypothetical protein
VGDERAETYLRLMAEPLTVPLTGPQDTIEVQVSGGRHGVRAVLPVRGVPEIADT